MSKGPTLNPTPTQTTRPRQIHTEQRQLICLECAYELDAIAVALPSMVPDSEDARGAHLLVRGMSARLRQLSTILVRAIDDDHETNERLEQLLLVRYASRQKE